MITADKTKDKNLYLNSPKNGAKNKKDIEQLQLNINKLVQDNITLLQKIHNIQPSFEFNLESVKKYSICDGLSKQSFLTRQFIKFKQQRSRLQEKISQMSQLNDGYVEQNQYKFLRGVWANYEQTKSNNPMDRIQQLNKTIFNLKNNIVHATNSQKIQTSLSYQLKRQDQYNELRLKYEQKCMQYEDICEILRTKQLSLQQSYHENCQLLQQLFIQQQQNKIIKQQLFENKKYINNLQHKVLYLNSKILLLVQKIKQIQSIQTMHYDNNQQIEEYVYESIVNKQQNFTIKFFKTITEISCIQTKKTFNQIIQFIEEQNNQILPIPKLKISQISTATNHLTQRTDKSKNNQKKLGEGFATSRTTKKTINKTQIIKPQQQSYKQQKIKQLNASTNIESQKKQIKIKQTSSRNYLQLEPQTLQSNKYSNMNVNINIKSPKHQKLKKQDKNKKMKISQSRNIITDEVKNPKGSHTKL